MQLTSSDLACERGGRTVFSNQNFTLGSGELLQLTGPNGAGKSSLLRLLANLGEPSQGKILLAGGAPDLNPGQQAHYIPHRDASKSALHVPAHTKFRRNLLGSAEDWHPSPRCPTALSTKTRSCAAVIDPPRDV